MTENPQRREDLEEESEKPCEKAPETPERGAWSDDQRKKSYYYDDAHGYEVFDPDEPEGEEGEKGRRGEGEIFSR